MAKLRDIAKGTRAVKVVPFRPANAPPLEAGAERDDHTIDVGVRVLTGDEIAEAYSAAQEAALRAGAPQWLDTHPLCRLHEMAQTIAVACVDVDSTDRAEPFFVGGAQEALSSPELGGENIAYLYQQFRDWEDECRGTPLDTATPAEVISFVVEEAERPENAAGAPFSRLRPSSQRNLVHSICVLCTSLLTARSLSSSPDDSSTPSTSESQPPKADE
jgi:hypothetical protein